jgi:hypothetical protein
MGDYRPRPKRGRGGKRMRDFKGKKVNKLSVLCYHSRNRGKTFNGREKNDYDNYWLCLCECGRMTLKRTRQLYLGGTKSCGCLKRISGVSNPHCSRRTDKARMARDMFTKYRSSAKAKGREFKLTSFQFYKLILGDCSYCGSPPRKRSFKVNKKRVTGRLNGVDRVDNNLGYVDSNCVSCCSDCNYIKGELSEKEFHKQINRVALHQIRERGEVYKKESK